MSDNITMSEVLAICSQATFAERLYIQTLLTHKTHMSIMDLKRKEFDLALIKAANITTNVEVHEMEVSRPKRHKARIDTPNGWFEDAERESAPSQGSKQASCSRREFWGTACPNAAMFAAGCRRTPPQQSRLGPGTTDAGTTDAG